LAGDEHLFKNDQEHMFKNDQSPNEETYSKLPEDRLCTRFLFG
jgi:hypothetical protein